MELSDYLAVIRRRWVAILAVAVVLGGGLGAFTLAREVRSYVAESQIGLREERRLVASGDIAQFASSDPAAANYYARETLVASRQVQRLAAAIYLAYKESPQRHAPDFWKSGDDASIRKALVDKGLLTGSPDAAFVGPLPLVEAQIRPLLDKFRAPGLTWTKPTEKIHIIHVKAISTDPADAVLMANAFGRAAELQSGLQVKTVLELAWGHVQAKIRESEERIETKSRELGVTDEDIRERERQITLASEELALLDRQLLDLRVRQDKLNRRIRELEEAEHRTREAVPAPQEDKGLASEVLRMIRTDLNAVRVSIAERTLVWTAENPDFKRLMARQAHLQQQERQEVYRLRGQALLDLRDQLGDLDIEHRTLDERRLKKSLEVEKLRDDLNRRDPLRADLSRLRKEQEGYFESRRRLEAARAVQQGFYSLEEAAQEAVAGERRALRIIPLYVLLGVLVAFALGFLLEYLDTSLRSDYDVKRHLNLPSIAMVEDTGSGDPLILRASPRDPLSELYNVAATVLRTYMTERQFKTVLVTSAVPQEGKTTVATNLAVALARKGLRVVLVDTDLRIPQVHAVFNLDNSRGVMNLLRTPEGEEIDLEGNMTQTEVPTLKVLTSGQPGESPVELLESGRMAEIVKTLREKFDIVVLDSPPVTSVGDSLTLARLADTCVMVIGSGLSDRRVVTWTKQLLANVRADIAGAIVNFAAQRAGGKYYYYYSYGGGGRGRSVRRE